MLSERMMIIENLEDYVVSPHPIVLTIGNFDGMHKGHCAVLKQAQALLDHEGEMLILTFRNHPSEILKPDSPTPLLCSLPHKLRLLKQHGAGNVLLLPFTHYLAKRSAYSFIENIRQYIPFSHLVLGHDATIGRDRQGNSALMQELGMAWGFNVHYLEEYRYEGKPVSSTGIRQALKQGEFDLVEELLDRPYSIFSQLRMSGGKKEQLSGYPTAHVEITGLCLPPFGVYDVEVLFDCNRFQGIANLGTSCFTTLRENSSPVLEVLLFEKVENGLTCEGEVIFKSFIRPEQKFQSMDDLQKQIQKDIASMGGAVDF